MLRNILHTLINRAAQYLYETLENIKNNLSLLNNFNKHWVKIKSFFLDRYTKILICFFLPF